jgi:hypothetical protein
MAWDRLGAYLGAHLPDLSGDLRVEQSDQANGTFVVEALELLTRHVRSPRKTCMSRQRSFSG